MEKYKQKKTSTLLEQTMPISEPNTDTRYFQTILRLHLTPGMARSALNPRQTCLPDGGEYSLS
jgi:hypothetical protein